MKDKKWNMKKLKGWIPFLLIVLFMSLVSAYYYFNHVLPVAAGEGKFFTRDIDEESSYVLTEKEIVQEYTTTRDHMTRIGLGFQKFGDISGLTVYVKFRDAETGETIQNWEIEAERLLAGGDFDYFTLSNPLVGKERRTELVVSVNDSNQKGQLALYKSKNLDKYGAISVNGEKEARAIALSVYGPVPYIAKLFVLLTAGFILLLGVIWFLIFKVKKVKIENVFLIAAFALGLVYLMVFTPYSEPDSKAHVATSFYYANMLSGKETVNEEGNVYARGEDVSCGGYIEFLGLDNINTTKEKLFHSVEDEQQGAFQRGKLQVPITAHLPQTLGTLIGILTGAGAVTTLYLGKFFALLFYIMCGYFGIKMIPFAKSGLMVTLLLPFSLETATSYSYDNTVLSISFLMIAYAMYLKFEKKCFTVKDMILWCILTFWLAPCKVIYFFIAFLIVLVPKKKFKKNSLYYGAIGLTAGVTALSLVISRLTTISGAVSGSMGKGYTISMFLKQPMKSFLLIGRTIYEYMDFYLQQIFGGTYSWFDISLPWFYVICYILLFCIGFLGVKEGYYLKTGEKLYIGAICILVIAAIAASMLFTWTPADSLKIEGIQGRYVLPVLPLFACLFRNRLVILRENIDGKILAATVLIQFLTVMQLFVLIIAR